MHQSAQNYFNVLITCMFEPFNSFSFSDSNSLSNPFSCLVSPASTYMERMGVTGLHDYKMTVFFKGNKQTFSFISLSGA